MGMGRRRGGGKGRGAWLPVVYLFCRRRLLPLLLPLGVGVRVAVGAMEFDWTMKENGQNNASG